MGGCLRRAAAPAQAPDDDQDRDHVNVTWVTDEQLADILYDPGDTMAYIQYCNQRAHVMCRVNPATGRTEYELVGYRQLD